MTTFARRMIAGTAVVAASGIAARLLALITVPILTRALGPVPYGQAALLATAVNIAAILALCGIDLGYARFGLQGEAGRQARVERFVWRWAVGAGLLSGGAAAGGWWLFQRDAVDPAGLTAAYVLFASLATALLAVATARARLKGRYGGIALGTLVGAVVVMGVSIYLAINVRADVWALLIGTMAGAVVAVLMIGASPVLGVLRASGLSWSERREVLALGAAITVTGPVTWIISSCDRWFVAAHSGAEAVGVYAVAAQLGLLGLLLNSAITLAWFPEVTRLYDQDGDAALPVIGDNAGRVAGGLLIAWLAVSVGGGDLLRLMTAPAFHVGAAYIPWIAAGVLFYGLGNLSMTGLFLGKRMRFTALAWALGGLAAVAAYAVLTPRWGGLGAAVGQSIAYGVIALVTWIGARRVMVVPMPYGRMAVCGTLAAAAAAAMQPAWHAMPIFSLALKAPAGLAVAVVIVRLLEPGLLTRLAEMVRVKWMRG